MSRLDAPQHYDDERKDIWAETVTRLTAGGRIFRADPEVLNTYVEAVRSHRQASRILGQTNVMITRDGKAFENPALAIQRRSADAMAKASRALGLNWITVDPDQVPPSNLAAAASPMRGRWCEEHQRRECVSPRKGGRGPCHSDKIVTGSDKCRMHLGGKAQPAIAAARLEQEAARLLYRRDAAPVANPLEALQALAGRALALEEVIGEKVNELRSIRYETEGGGEQIRGELQVLERAMDRCARLLTDIAKLNIEGRLAGIRKQTADMLERALDAALEASGAGLEEKEKARETFKRNLKVVA